MAVLKVDSKTDESGTAERCELSIFELVYRFKPSRAKIGVILSILVLLLGDSGCGGEDLTVPEVSPTPVQGFANATMLDNLPLVLSLEKQYRALPLTNIGGNSNLTGNLQPTSSWVYIFTDFKEFRVYTWKVGSDGIIEEPRQGEYPVRFPEGTDMALLLKLDSDEAIEIALNSGAREFVERYPNTNVRVSYEVQFGLPVSYLIFEDVTGASGICSIRFWIHSSSGELLAREIECLDW